MGSPACTQMRNQHAWQVQKDPLTVGLGVISESAFPFPPFPPFVHSRGGVTKVGVSRFLDCTPPPPLLCFSIYPFIQKDKTNQKGTSDIFNNASMAC